jgi:hypothetical protein
MVKKIVGGVIALAIGGTTYAVSNSAIVSNFSTNSGMSQQQAQQYIKNIPQSDLETFSKLGQGLVSDGNSILSESSSIDCTNYTYQWETSSLTCSDGDSQLQTVGNDEVTLGNCYQTLDTNLGDGADAKINECIADIDTVDSAYSLPIVTTLLDSGTITDNKNTDAYNKSVLQAALQSN